MKKKDMISKEAVLKLIEDIEYSINPDNFKTGIVDGSMAELAGIRGAQLELAQIHINSFREVYKVSREHVNDFDEFEDLKIV